MSTKIATLPPKAPRYKSLLRLQRFIKNPIPFMEDNLAEYGDTYRFSLRYSKENILTRDPDVIEHILRKNGANYEKPVAHSDSLGAFIGKGLLLATGDTHKRRRRIMQPAFHRKKIAALLDILVQEIDTYLDEYDAENGNKSTVEWHSFMKHMSFKTMTRAIFGESMDEEMASDFYTKFMELQSFFIKLVRFPYLLRWYNWRGVSDEKMKLAAELQDIVRKIVVKRRKDTKEHSDLLQMLIDARYEDTDEGLSDEILIQESLVLFVAGHETAADTMTWSMYLLGKHPQAGKKILEEASEKFGNNNPDFMGLVQSEYLAKFIDESMRLYPPSWITDRVAKEDDEINGFLIPAGTRVIPFIYGLHHNPKVWENPEAFNPERFETEAKRKRHNYAHIPFGGGSRMCIGRNFALMEKQVVIIRVLQRYNLSLVPNHKVELLPSLTLKPRNGVKMVLEKK